MKRLSTLFKKSSSAEQAPEKSLEPTTTWCIGWKVSNIYVLDDLRTLNFVPVHQDGLIYTSPVDDVAKCQQWSHQSPDNNCRCGFNAWHESDHATRYYWDVMSHPQIVAMQRMSLVILRVGLYGDVIEGTLRIVDGSRIWGYRASRQRVADIFIEPICHVCRSKATNLGVYDHDNAWGWPVRPFCDEHIHHSPHVLSIPALSRQNNVEFHWSFTSE